MKKTSLLFCFLALEGVSCPSELRITQQSKYAWETGISRSIHICDFVLPLYMYYLMETGQVESIQLPEESLVSYPDLTNI